MDSRSHAAAAQKEEEHKSAFSHYEVRRYVEATKPHATNPGGLARSIWRSGEEDLEIRKWIDAEEQKTRIRSAVLVGPNDDFDFSVYIEGLISRGDLAQLQNEREGIESRGGPQADWEKRVFDYFNRAAEENA